MAVTRRWKLAIVASALYYPTLLILTHIPMPAGVSDKVLHSFAYLTLAFLFWISSKPQRRTVAIVALAVYWPTLFIFAHIPVPEEVQKAGVSDKALHFLAYATLVFLLWIALNPQDKVRWRKATVWWVLLIVAAYGVIDELLQGYVGRSCEMADLEADLAGAFAGCVILTFFTLWPAAFIVVAAIIFGLTNIARENPADFMPFANAMFHLFSYAVFTLIWIRCMAPPQVRLSDSLRALKPNRKWLITALASPIALLVVVKGYSIAQGKYLPIYDVILSVGGIVGAVGIWAGVLFRRSANQGSEGPDG